MPKVTQSIVQIKKKQMMFRSASQRMIKATKVVGSGN